MKTKIFYGNQFVEKFNCDGRKYTKRQIMIMKISRWIREKIILSAKICIIAWLVVGGLKVGQHLTPPSVVYADKVIERSLAFEDIPMLVKICQAESGSRQFKANGDVLRGKVNLSDIGYCQINEYINNDLARKLGYDIYTEKGNKDFAVYLYLNRGTQPWSASKSIWSK